eukprot:1037944-Amphidinium_carterae.1
MGNHEDSTTQVAYLVGMGRKGNELDGPFSLLSYQSHKLKRVAASTLMTETLAMSEGLAETEWILAWLSYLEDVTYEHRGEHRRNVRGREIKLQDIQPKGHSKEVWAVTDSKSLYDVLGKESLSSIDRKAALELRWVRDTLEELNGQCRWVPHDRNPADTMTKQKGNAQVLLMLMKEAKFVVPNEDHELEQRKQYRQATGKKCPRPSKVNES